MSSLLAAPNVVGRQEPRLSSVPDYHGSSGPEAIELAAMAGLYLDPWQQLVLTGSLGERLDGRWAAFEVGVVVPRQNGKDGLLEARQLAGLFLLGERLIIHTAHQFDTSLEAFRRLLTLIEGSEDLSRRVKRVSRAHGEEGIELLSGQRVRFRTRTKGGGRGFSGDLLILNEAMIIPKSAHGATLPTLSARPNPQVWYTGSAVDQDIHEHGEVLASVRERGVSGKDPALAYFEWSVDAELDQVAEVAGDEEAWAEANPALGVRISSEHVAFEHRSMDARTFAVERLGVGDWPVLGVAGQGIPVEAWDACADRESAPGDPVCFAFDVRPDRSMASIGVAGMRADGHRHIEVVEHRKGTGWIPGRLAELVERHQAMSVHYDQGSPAASLAASIEALGVKLEPVSLREHAQACGLIFDGVEERSIRHLGTAELSAAIRGAVKRTVGDAWLWSRKSSAVDISPLVACTIALWGLDSAQGPEQNVIFEVFT